MKRNTRFLVVALGLSLPALVVMGIVVWRVTPAAAITTPNYAIKWNVIGGGGQASTSAHFRINGTAGQSAASPSNSTSSNYIISGGYWYGAIACCWDYVAIVIK